MAKPRGFGHEGFGTSEIQVHIQAHGKMVLVVGDIELDNLRLLIVLHFHKGKDEAIIFASQFVEFDHLLPSIHDALS